LSWWRFVRRERTYSRIHRSLAFPEEVIPDRAEATLKDGLLEVRIPKKTPTEVKKHKVEIKWALRIFLHVFQRSDIMPSACFPFGIRNESKLTIS
jgi:hypothetical protein